MWGVFITGTFYKTYYFLKISITFSITLPIFSSLKRSILYKIIFSSAVNILLGLILLVLFNEPSIKSSVSIFI